MRGVGPNVLAQRLRELEQTGVVRRRKLPPPGISRGYELIEWDLELLVRTSIMSLLRCG